MRAAALGAILRGRVFEKRGRSPEQIVLFTEAGKGAAREGFRV